jgi:hypothetical protein
MKEPAYKTRMFRTLLKGQVFSYFEHHLMRRLEAEDPDVPDNDLIEKVLGVLHIGVEYIPIHEIFVPMPYMMRGLCMGLNTSVQRFVERKCLNDLNYYLLYFSKENHKQLDQDEIIEILDQANTLDTKSYEKIANTNIDIFEMSPEE